MKVLRTTLMRFAATLAIGAAAHLPQMGISHAAGPRPLKAGDFFQMSTAAVMVPTATSPVPTIAGEHFARALIMGSLQTASFNTARIPGYGALQAQVGITDNSDAGTTAPLIITGDGKVLYSHVFTYGQVAVRIVVPFGKAQAITIANGLAGSQNLLLANPVLLPSGASTPPTAPGASSGKASLQFFSATATAGGQQTALITAAKNALVAIVIDYPDGTQVIVPSKRAGPDGHYAYTWTVPDGIHGLVHITVDAAGAVTQGTFTVR